MMSLFETEPPAQLEAEEAVIGAILIDETAYDRAMSVASIDDYALGAHREILNAMETLIQRGVALDVVTVSEELAARKRLDEAGGMPYIGSLALNVPTAANVEHYAEIVASRAALRRMRIAITRAANWLDSRSGKSAAEIETMIHEEISKAAAGAQDAQDFGRIGDEATMNELIENLDRRGGNELQGLTTSLAGLDRLTTGMRPGQLWIIAGRPAMGKSALAEQVAICNAKEGRKVLYFSLEMSRAALLERAFANVQTLDATRLRRGDLREEEFESLTLGMESMSNLPIYIDATGICSIEKLRARARQMRAGIGLDLIVVDYLQLMQGSGHDIRERVTNLSRELKLAAMTLDIPVVVLSQLSRNCESRVDKRPLLSDLRESGSIEQDADVALMLYRDEIYNKDSRAKGVAEIIVRKQRDGETGTVYANFAGTHYRFSNCEYEPPLDEQPAKRRKFIA